MYYEYWGLNRAPFDNVPDPAMYFRAHQTVEQAVGEVLFAIEEGDEILAVVVGEVGLGKTTSLRVVLDSLDQDKYRIAFVTNPDVTFSMLLREINGQLMGQPCTIRRKDELLEAFNHILFETADEGKRVLIFIDEGNAFKPVNLESLRLLTNMQEDDRNLFTIILAGQPKLAKMLEAPARANLFQRIGVYCHLEKMDSWEVVRDYIDHRLERAGRTEAVFTDDAVKAIYEYSEQGVPRLVNKIAKLALKAGETNGSAIIGSDVVEAIGERFRRFTKKDKKHVSKKPRAKKPVTPAAKEPAPEENVVPEENLAPQEDVAPEEVRPEPPEAATMPVETTPEVEPLEWGPRQNVSERKIWPAETGEGASPSDQAGDESGGYYYESAGAAEPRGTARFEDNEDETAAAISLSAVNICLDDVLGPEVLEKARTADKRERIKMAGQLAAEGIKKHPEYVRENNDPVLAWQELRDEILSAFSRE